MRNRWLQLLLVGYVFLGCTPSHLMVSKFTANNPVSITDVVYTGTKDTVLYATYSGKIAQVINGYKKEKVIAMVGDEVYSIDYNPYTKQIAAATLEHGIEIINKNGKIIQRLSLPLWSVGAFYADDYRYLIAQGQHGKSYVWDVGKNYEPLDIPGGTPNGKMQNINQHGIAEIISAAKISFWDIGKKILVKEITIDLGRPADEDSKGNYLFIDFNECVKYDANAGKVVFKLKHPDWPLPNVEDETEVYKIPLHLQLTTARFAKDKIYTAGIDRTIRVWDRQTGMYLATWTGHKATIDKIKLSKNEDQLVSVDLKGGVRFWELNN